MEMQQSQYYAEILILVDGWPWNLSEFDFRRFFAPGSCPAALAPVADAAKTATSRVSENRRVGERRGQSRDRRRAESKPARNKKARRAQVEALARALVEKAA